MGKAGAAHCVAVAGGARLAQPADGAEPDEAHSRSGSRLLDHVWFSMRLVGEELGSGKRRRSSGGLPVDEPTPEEVHAEMCTRCNASDVVPDPNADFGFGPTSSQGASGWMDRGFLVATASMGATPGGAPAQAPLPDDQRFMGETFIVDCLRPVGGTDLRVRASLFSSLTHALSMLLPAETGDYYTAEAFCAASARLASLELGPQPQDARDTAALRLRVDEGLARGDAFTVQVVAVRGQLYLHLQLVPTAPGGTKSPASATRAVQPFDDPACFGSASKEGSEQSRSGTPRFKGPRAHRAAPLELPEVAGGPAQRLTELFAHLAADDAHQHAPMERGDEHDDFLMESDAINELVPG